VIKAEWQGYEKSGYLTRASNTSSIITRLIEFEPILPV